MENLDRLTNTGLPLYDLNSEYIDRTNWEDTPLGSREGWPASLESYVRLITTFPHPAAVFWGESLSKIHNLAWVKASQEDDGQGKDAAECFDGEGLGSLWTAVRGRTVKVASKFLLSNLPDDASEAPVLLSTLLDEKLTRVGVLAQLIHGPRSERAIDSGFLSNFDDRGPAQRTKDIPQQQKTTKSNPKDAKQNELFQKFAELLPNGLAILDSEAEAIFVNDGFFKLTTNRTEKNFRAWPESIDSRDYERVMGEYRSAFSSRSELRVEFRCAATAPEEWRLFLMRPLRKEPEAGFICAVVDITEIKSAELSQEKAAVEAQQRKEQQERFIDMVSHEIRNPLSAVLHLADEIKDASDSLKSKYDVNLLAEIIDAADTILLCVQHQNVLVDDILSFSKLDSKMMSLTPSVVQPKWEFSLALKVFQSEMKSKNISFNYAMDVSFRDLEVDYVVADLNRIKQVLINLVTNAIKFTSKKDGDRQISVAMGATKSKPSSYPPNVVFFETKQDKYHIDSTLSNEWGQGPALYLMVAVKDTGIGISAANQAKLFERFRQATPKTQEKYGGSGLGLFISRKICQLHGGDIGVSSKEGQGSTFGFYFRVRQSSEQEKGQRPSLNRAVSSYQSNRSRSRDEVPRVDGEKPELEVVDLTKSVSAPPDASKQDRGDDKVRALDLSDDLSPPWNSNLQAHKEQEKRVDGLGRGSRNAPVASQPGVDAAKTPQTLTSPPVEYLQEAHPSASADDRYEQTASVAQAVAANSASNIHQLQESLSERHADGHSETSGPDHARRKDDKQCDGSSNDSIPTLLLVEDNLINQKVLRRQLQARGFQVDVANNGQDAVDTFKRKAEELKEKTHNGTYDCILMDQEMPVKDGNAASAEIREFEQNENIPHGVILGVSANVREEQRNAMLDAGMDDVISKPYKVDELVRRIRGLLSPN
ncbi:MAG: hypothetical protein M1820_010895 [Bogoriella megaspora]|nr:MAG: hypothetical protein M1820_010895 [Bogoriella megaspora]